MRTMISCILLSAGLSSRFGSAKALAKISEKQTVIKILQTQLIASQISEILVVLGAHSEAVKPHIFKHTKLKVVYNKDYILGQTSSFKAGLAQVSPKSSGILILPVDFAFIKTTVLDYLIECFWQEKKASILIPIFQNRKGHPPLFQSSLKNEFLELDNNLGINEVFYRHQESTKLLPVEDPAVVSSFNTQEEFKNLKAQFGYC